MPEYNYSYLTFNSIRLIYTSDNRLESTIKKKPHLKRHRINKCIHKGNTKPVVFLCLVLTRHPIKTNFASEKTSSQEVLLIMTFTVKKEQTSRHFTPTMGPAWVRARIATWCCASQSIVRYGFLNSCLLFLLFHLDDCVFCSASND